MKHASPPRRPTALIQLLLVTGLLAVVGGLGLVLRADGRWLRLPLELLEETPFTSYLIPGLVLAVVVGGTQLAAGMAAWKLRPGHLRMAAMAAAVLGIWIAAQALILGAVIWLQPLFFLVAVVELMMVGAAVPRKTGAAHRKSR